MPILSLDLAKSHLRVTWAAEDQLIDVYIGASEGAAASFLNRRVYSTIQEMEDAIEAGVAGEDPMVANDEIRAAMLLTLGHIYNNRDDVVIGATAVELPLGARSLLQPYRVGMGV